ncbi:MAG: RDD family protein [Phycisphaeraceae bacterium]|nr:RDD family protein [Phycisphaeraceae bacterium]
MTTLRTLLHGVMFAMVLIGTGVAMGDDGAAHTANTAPTNPAAKAPAIAPHPSVIAASGGGEHLWFVLRRGALAASLGHVAPGMNEGEYRPGLPISAHPAAIGAWGGDAWLLFPPRSALLPRSHLLATGTRRNPATGLWISAPGDRLILQPQVPSEALVESMVASPEGVTAIFEGEPTAWQLRRGSWNRLSLPEPVESASKRRLEPRESGLSVLATSGAQGTWDRWRGDGEVWTQHPLGLDGDFEIQPVGGPALIALVTRSGGGEAGTTLERKVMTLPDDGPRLLLTLDDSIPEGSALAWFREAPYLIDGATGSPRLRRIDPIEGSIAAPVVLSPQRSLASAWSHLPILGAVVISLLMVVFFVRSIRDEREQRLPEGWEPMPFTLRLAALGVDLVPGIVITKFMLGVPWSAFLSLPWLVVDSDAALPMIVAPIVTVFIAMLWEFAFATTPGKRIFGGRVISMRADAPSIDPTPGQTLARNIFKSVVLQMQLLAIFTLLHPLGQGVGETISATCVVRRRAVTEAAPTA